MKFWFSDDEVNFAKFKEEFMILFSEFKEGKKIEKKGFIVGSLSVKGIYDKSSYVLNLKPAMIQIKPDKRNMIVNIESVKKDTELSLVLTKDSKLNIEGNSIRFEENGLIDLS